MYCCNKVIIIKFTCYKSDLKSTTEKSVEFTITLMTLVGGRPGVSSVHKYTSSPRAPRDFGILILS